MKVVHSSILLALAIPIVCMTTKNKVSKKHRYLNILRLTMLAEITYIFPLAFNIKKSLNEKEMDNANIFSDWLSILINDTNVNVFGVKTMFAITFGIFALLILIQFTTCWL